MRRPTLSPLVLLAGLAVSAVSPGWAKVLLSVEEALALAFPGCTIQRETVYLTAAELETARQRGGTELASAVVFPYRARWAEAGGKPCGTGYLDTHRVRTLAETVMVAINAQGEILRVETLSFDEPLDYLPRDEWYAQFTGRGLTNETELGRAVRPVTGATLTARATTDAARRALALDRVLAARAAPAGVPP